MGEQMFLFDDEEVPAEIVPQDPELCPFCGGNPHLNDKILRTRVYLEAPLIPKRYEHVSVYVYCGRCRARGPIVARTLKRRTEVGEMRVEAIRKWNSMRGGW